MPSKSPKQARLMQAIAHGWKPPKKSGIHVPVKVAKEFVAADERKPSRSQMMAKIARRRNKQLAR